MAYDKKNNWEVAEAANNSVSQNELYDLIGLLSEEDRDAIIFLANSILGEKTKNS